MPKQPDTTPTTVGDNDCAICFAELTGSVIQTECAHKFHLACLSQWLTGPDATATPSCPLCRSPLKETTAVLAGIAATATAATAAPAASPTPTPTPTPTPVPIANAIANANVNALASLSRPPPRQQWSQRRAMNRVPNRALLSNQLGTPHSRSYARTDIRVPAEDPLPPAKEAPEEVSTAPATSTAGDTAPLPADGDAGEGAMAMRFTTEFSALAAAVETDLYSMLTIKAPASNTVDVDNVDDDDLDDVVEDARLPMDLVVVCDKSGSMQGEKMELLRQTVSFVAEELEARDRLCVVAFNGSAEFMCGLECMTETGKGRMAANIVSSPLMRAGGGTDIGAGLTYGLEALRRREETNAITSVLLLSDGQDSRTASNIGSILADNPAGSVHVFGLGADHDAVTLAAIAEAGNGTFSYIEDAELIGDSFSAVLGGLSSTVAARVAVEIVVPEGSSIVSLKTHYTSSVSADRRTATVNIPDLYEEEEKDIVFVWHAAAAADGPGSSTTLAAHLEWSTPGSAETAARSTLDTTGDLPRPAAVEPHDLVANIGLDAQRNRVVAAEALEAAMAAADAGDLETARAVIDAAIETLTTSVSADMEQVAALRADLEESKTRMASRQVYSRGGHAYMASNMQGHKKQRAAVQSNIDDRAGAYSMNKRQKLKMRKMKKAAAMKAMH